MTHELNIKSFNFDYLDNYAMIICSVNGSEVAEYLDEDGDVDTSSDCHFNSGGNESDVPGSDIHAAMQSFIDSMPEAKREELRKNCAEVHAAAEVAKQA